MNVLIIGSGGREHALAWKIKQSRLLESLYIAPGNAGTASTGQNINLGVSDFKGIREFVLNNQIGMVVVGPEVPLVEGIHDFFKADPSLMDVVVIGPARRAAMMEGINDFAKSFMIRNKIPTARYQAFSRDQYERALEFLDSMNPPYVLKADGLAAGKGVIICETRQEAVAELKSMLLDARFGEAGKLVLIEEFLRGIELSAFILTDGLHYQILPSAKDYKRIGEGDTGPNTGGMGSISPVPFADEIFNKKMEEKIITPTMNGLIREGIDYIGFIFFGLINVEGEPYVIEYNARMGDPEAESVIPRIQNDLLEMFIAAGKKELKGFPLKTDPRHVVSVMLVSDGYPGSYEKDKPISGLDQVEDVIIFHAGTAWEDNSNLVKTSGGRIMTVTAFGDTLVEAMEKSYHAVGKISYENKSFRKDIGQDLLKYYT